MKKIICFSIAATLIFGAAHSIAQCSPAKFHNTVSDVLGWIDDSDPSNLCHGHFAPFLYPPSQHLVENNVSDISARSADFARDGASILEGDVSVTQATRKVQAQKVRIVRDAKKKQIVQIDAQTNVRLHQPGQLIVAERAHLNLPQHRGYLTNITYRFDRGSKTNNGWGHARLAKQINKDVLHLFDADYGTCSPTNDSWRISAQKIVLNNDTGVGTAKNLFFLIKNHRVLYLPYYRFSIDDRRQTGFLLPVFSHSARRGFDFTTPFYVNLAPNYDLTLNPRYMTKRGAMIGADFRYLTEHTIGDFKFDYLPEDHTFELFRANTLGITSENDNRAFVQFRQETLFNQNWDAQINLNYVSDDYYFQDFTNNLAITSTQQLPRRALLHYHDIHWDFLANLEGYQTLHPIGQAAVADLYYRLPQLSLHMDYPNFSAHIHPTLTSEYVYFDWPGPRFDTKPSGSRFHFMPGISFPWQNPAGFFTPSIQLAMTQYSLTHREIFASTLSRTLPIVNIDTGLFFDRNTDFFHHHYRQTLEPRLFYLYVPYRDQDAFPLFDTSQFDFTFDQLFRTNRFTGNDRIGDANQLSLALTSRFLDNENGEERFRTSIGVIRYFADRKVAYCGQLGPQCSNLTTGSPLNYTSPIARYSPVASQLIYHFNPFISTTANYIWDTHAHQTNNASLLVNVAPTTDSVFNFGYSYARSTLVAKNDVKTSLESTQLIGTSAAFPVDHHWSLLGSFSYNLAHSYPQTYFIGAQYDSCCFAVRAIAVRTLRSVTPDYIPSFDNSINLQIRLKGLGTLGSDDPHDMLVNDISGYRDPFKELQ